jgi:hypothetical protein
MTVLPRYRLAFSVLVSDGEVIPGRRVDRVLEMIMIMILDGLIFLVLSTVRPASPCGVLELRQALFLQIAARPQP